MSPVTDVDRTRETSAWATRPFRRLWLASGLAALAGEMTELGIPLFALLALSADPVELSMLRTAQFAPFLLLTLWLGVVVDRMRRRPLLVTAGAARGVLLVVLAATAVVAPPFWVAVAIVFLIGAFTVVHQLADFAFVPSVVSPARLADANAKLSATESASTIAGNGVAGAVVQLLSAPLALIVNGATFLASAVLIGTVRSTETRAVRHPDEESHVLRDIREGFGALWRNRTLRALVAEAATWNLFNEVFMLAFTVTLVTSGDFGDSGALALGLILVAGGTGAFVGAWCSAWATRRFGYGRSLIVTLILGNAAPLLVSLPMGHGPAALVVFGIAFLVSGLGIGVANSQSVTIRQLVTEPTMRGRVNSGYRLISWGMLAVGAGLAGVVIAYAGTAVAMLVGAAGMASATLWVLCSPVRRMRTLTDVEQARRRTRRGAVDG